MHRAKTGQSRTWQTKEASIKPPKTWQSRTWQSRTWQTNDTGTKPANDPRQTRYIPNDPMPVQQGNIALVPPRRRNPT